MRLVLAALFHVSPLLPLFLGHRPLAAALALAVIALYVKDQKLTAQLGAVTGVGPKADQERREIIAARGRWRYLMLKGPAAAESGDGAPTPSQSDV